jgi:hypothetical protein
MDSGICSNRVEELENIIDDQRCPKKQPKRLCMLIGKNYHDAGRNRSVSRIVNRRRRFGWQTFATAFRDFNSPPHHAYTLPPDLPLSRLD